MAIEHKVRAVTDACKQFFDKRAPHLTGDFIEHLQGALSDLAGKQGKDIGYTPSRVRARDRKLRRLVAGAADTLQRYDQRRLMLALDNMPAEARVLVSRELARREQANAESFREMFGSHAAHLAGLGES